MTARHDAVATQLTGCDATEQPFHICHFQGRGTLTLYMACTRHQEMRLTRSGARQLAHVLDHFARTLTLPIFQHHDSDWSI